MATKKRHSTCILLFAERAEVASTRKQLVGNERRNLFIHERLIGHTLDVVKSTGIPYHWVDDTRQKGNNFAERLFHAVEDTFALGYERIILIGADHPQLHRSHIMGAAESLQKEQCCIGASKDGGTYLLAGSKQFFTTLKAAKIPWESGEDAKAIAHHFAKYVDAVIHWLPTLYDWDSFIETQLFLSQFRHTLWMKTILPLLHLYKKSKLVSDIVFFSFSHVIKRVGRAPPLLQIA